MRILILATAISLALMCPLSSKASPKKPNQPKEDVTLSVFVAKNIHFYLKENYIIFETNLSNTFLISVNRGDDHFQYTEKKQTFQVPAMPGSTITITESL